MFPVAFLAVVLSCAPVEFAIPVGPDSLAELQRQQQQDAKPAPAEKPPADAAQQAPATPAAPAKPADKPKKVITNDDLKSYGDGGSTGGFLTGFGPINDCNKSCFDQVRMFARVDAAENPNWKREALDGIDWVRRDTEWQRYLRDVYDVRRKGCQLASDKMQELARFADPRNVTPQEIAIDEKYDGKIKAAQAELETVRARQDALLKRFAANPYALQFATVQGMRLTSIYCPPITIFYNRN